MVCWKMYNFLGHPVIILKISWENQRMTFWVTLMFVHTGSAATRVSAKHSVDSAFHPPWDGKMSISLRAE